MTRVENCAGARQLWITSVNDDFTTFRDLRIDAIRRPFDIAAASACALLDKPQTLEGTSGES